MKDRDHPIHRGVGKRPWTGVSALDDPYIGKRLNVYQNPCLMHLAVEFFRGDAGEFHLGIQQAF